MLCSATPAFKKYEEMDDMRCDEEDKDDDNRTWMEMKASIHKMCEELEEMYRDYDKRKVPLTTSHKPGQYGGPHCSTVPQGGAAHSEIPCGF